MGAHRRPPNIQTYLAFTWLFPIAVPDCLLTEVQDCSLAPCMWNLRRRSHEMRTPMAKMLQSRNERVATKAVSDYRRMPRKRSGSKQ